MATGINNNDAFLSLFLFHDIKYWKTDKNWIVSIKYSEATITARKINFFNRHMIDFVNILELKDHKYQSNVTLYEENYTGKLLFSIH